MRKLFAVFSLTLLIGCATNKPDPEPTIPGMVRPDGSFVPDPDYHTNVTPWIYDLTQ